MKETFENLCGVTRKIFGKFGERKTKFDSKRRLFVIAIPSMLTFSILPTDAISSTLECIDPYGFDEILQAHPKLRVIALDGLTVTKQGTSFALLVQPSPEDPIQDDKPIRFRSKRLTSKDVANVRTILKKSNEDSIISSTIGEVFSYLLPIAFGAISGGAGAITYKMIVQSVKSQREKSVKRSADLAPLVTAKSTVHIFLAYRASHILRVTALEIPISGEPSIYTLISSCKYEVPTQINPN